VVQVADSIGASPTGTAGALGDEEIRIVPVWRILSALLEESAWRLAAVFEHRETLPAFEGVNQQCEEVPPATANDDPVLRHQPVYRPDRVPGTRYPANRARTARESGASTLSVALSPTFGRRPKHVSAIGAAAAFVDDSFHFGGELTERAAGALAQLPVCFQVT
jgi:hypothetical protein